MPKQKIKVTLEFEYDTDEHKLPPRIFLYQLINRLNYEYPVKMVEYGGKKKLFSKRDDVANVGLKKHDDLDEPKKARPLNK